MKEVYKGNRITCSDHGFSSLSSCADFVGTFEECRTECTERPNVSQNSNMRNHSGSDIQLSHFYDSGCTIPSAYNYDPTSTSDVGSCLWYDESVGSGNVLSSYFAACDWNEWRGYFLNHIHVGNTTPLQFPQQCPYINYGCTDPSADNYNSSADQDWTVGASSMNQYTPTLCVYDGQVSGLTSGKEYKKGGKRFRNQTGDWGGMSFQCADMPFASATGDKEEDMEDDIISEPPWWLVATAGFLGGLKKYKTCTCTNPENGTTMQISDCPIIRKCDKCCSSRWAGWIGEDSVQEVGQSRR